MSEQVYDFEVSGTGVYILNAKTDEGKAWGARHINGEDGWTWTCELNYLRDILYAALEDGLSATKDGMAFYVNGDNELCLMEIMD